MSLQKQILSISCMFFCNLCSVCYFAVFGLTTKLRFSSMCQVLSKIGTVHFFWAADFYNYMDVMEERYQTIGNITNFAHFRGVAKVSDFLAGFMPLHIK